MPVESFGIKPESELELEKTMLTFGVLPLQKCW
jgi:hypothetical protein